MERHWSLMIAVVLAAVTGCANTSKTTANATPQSYWEQFQSQVHKATGQEKPPAPAVEFACAWQNRLQQLPDPSRGGQMTTGVVGQIFLYARAGVEGEVDFVPAEVNGDLVLVVSDATPRPAGVKGVDNEVWHFTKETLKKMVMTDERFGKGLIVFLPWPAHWQNVNTLSIQARYDQPGGNTLYAQPKLLTLDLQNQYGTGIVNNGTAPASFMPVPDPKMVMKQMTAPPMGNPVQQASVFSPPTPFDTKNPIFAPPPANIAPTGMYAPPQQNNFAPTGTYAPPAATPASVPGAATPREFGRMVIPRS